MTAPVLVEVVAYCPNQFGAWYGREIGRIEVPALAASVTATLYCGKCRTYHRQTLKIG